MPDSGRFGYRSPHVQDHPGLSPAHRLTLRLSALRIDPAVALIGTLAMVGLSFLARQAANPWLAGGYQFVTFFPAVILTSFLFGTRAAALCGMLCGLVAWYVFVPPFHSFKLSVGVAVAMGFYATTAAVDIALVHWMQRANRAVAEERERNAKLAQTRELLFRELQHRVSNNLQVTAGLLSLQRRRIADGHARAALDEAARRIDVIGRISRQLYDPSGEGRDLAAFLSALADDVVAASGRADLACRVECPGGLTIEPDQAVPVALIVAEALANAIEHGFAGGRSGDLAIEVDATGERIAELRVSDDGGALPADFDASRSDSLGLRIATTLASQIGGRFSLVGGPRTVARLQLSGDATAR